MADSYTSDTTNGSTNTGSDGTDSCTCSTHCSTSADSTENRRPSRASTDKQFLSEAAFRGCTSYASNKQVAESWYELHSLWTKKRGDFASETTYEFAHSTETTADSFLHEPNLSDRAG